jgi:hypothetical protein
VNFLLPHIRREPNRIQRDEFSSDAAQKLGIDSALLRKELKEAAAQRLESVRGNNAGAASETERILLRALVLPVERAGAANWRRKNWPRIQSGMRAWLRPRCSNACWIIPLKLARARSIARRMMPAATCWPRFCFRPVRCITELPLARDSLPRWWPMACTR